MMEKNLKYANKEQQAEDISTCSPGHIVIYGM